MDTSASPERQARELAAVWAVGIGMQEPERASELGIVPFSFDLA